MRGFFLLADERAVAVDLHTVETSICGIQIASRTAQPRANSVDLIMRLIRCRMCAMNDAQILQDLPMSLLLSSSPKALCLVRAEIPNLDSTWNH